MNKRIFYIVWKHNCDSTFMAAVLTFDNAVDLLNFFSYEEDPLVYFAFEDITDKDIASYERKIEYVSKYAL